MIAETCSNWQARKLLRWELTRQVGGRGGQEIIDEDRLAIFVQIASRTFRRPSHSGIANAVELSGVKTSAKWRSIVPSTSELRSVKLTQVWKRDYVVSLYDSELFYRRYRLHPDIIQQTVWLYFRFTMSYRDVEDLLAERGIDASYETVRLWAQKFRPAYARRIRKRRLRPDNRWHLDEFFVDIDGKQMYLWQAIDGEGEVLDILVQKRRDNCAATKLMRKVLGNLGVQPAKIVTDRLKSHGAACRNMGSATFMKPAVI